MARFLIYCVIALLSFLAFVAVLAPAAPVWSLVSKDVLRLQPDLNVLMVDGTIWTGNAEISYRQLPTSVLSWDIAALALFKRKLHAQLNLAGDFHHFETELQMTQSDLLINNLNGTLNSQYINVVSKPQGLTFNGDISAEALSLKASPKRVHSASGHISWPGGKIISRTEAAGTRIFDLPPLDGELSMLGENLRLNIHHNNQTAVDIQLKPNGWVLVSVKALLFDLANQPWPAGTKLSDSVLEFEEKIL